MKIKKIDAREIYNSSGFPTIECTITLDSHESFTGSAPTGTSRSSYEAHEMRDPDRLRGKGVETAKKNIEKIIAPALVEKEPNVVQLDLIMKELDNTAEKTILGANATLAVSSALVKAHAYSNGYQIFELIADLYDANSVQIPFPLCNMIQGGLHEDNNLVVQEFLIAPIQCTNFREAMEKTTHFFHSLKHLLQKYNLNPAIGCEGGYAPNLQSEEDALEIIMQTMSDINEEGTFKIGLDVAATHFYNATTSLYQWHETQISRDELIQWYEKIIATYPIFYLEDPLYEDDWEGWHLITEKFGNTVQIVGDDIFATHPERIIYAIEHGIANAAIIKPNQIGTITETLQTIKLCQEHGFNAILSHRSQETDDTIIADLAVGTSAGQLKAGGCSRGERIAKYNRILRIEDFLSLMMFRFQ